HDSGWAPFAQGDFSEGELGRSRFQVAVCAYPEMVGALPSCGLDIPFIVGHRTAIHVDTEGLDAEGLTLLSTQGAIVVDSACPEQHYIRALITAAETGTASLVVRGLDGVEVDRILVDVREAASVTIEREDGDDVLALGEEATMRAVARSVDGEMLNAYSELRWRLLDGTGAVKLHGVHGWRVDVEALAAGGERLRSEVGALGADVAVTVE
ncbi:MAG: hypothetical protein RIF41_10095, partial [Polyangiaceae bacterium]